MSTARKVWDDPAGIAMAGAGAIRKDHPATPDGPGFRMRAPHGRPRMTRITMNGTEVSTCGHYSEAIAARHAKVAEDRAT